MLKTQFKNFNLEYITSFRTKRDISKLGMQKIWSDKRNRNVVVAVVVVVVVVVAVSEKMHIK